MNRMTPKEFMEQLGLSLTSVGVEVNDQVFSSVDEARGYLQKVSGSVSITLRGKSPARVQPNSSAVNPYSPKSVAQVMDGQLYQIKVKRYMTRTATPEFNFMSQWNNDVPMPLRVMVGRKLQETKGMVKMELWGQMVGETEIICMKCGRVLNNKVSQYFGLGPECGGHNYTNPFESKKELAAAVKENDKKLREMTWTGWIIKSAIETEVKIDDQGAY